MIVSPDRLGIVSYFRRDGAAEREPRHECAEQESASEQEKNASGSGQFGSRRGLALASGVRQTADLRHIRPVRNGEELGPIR
jgi:hypothetical protein